MQGNFSKAGNAFLESGMHGLGMDTANDKDVKRLYDKKNGIASVGEMGGNIMDGFKNQFNSKKPPLMPTGNDGKNTKGVNDAIDKGKKSEGSGGSTQGAIRNVTLNNNAPLIGVVNVYTTTVREAIPDISNALKEALVRAERDTELSIAD
jgi:hypothetical protein